MEGVTTQFLIRELGAIAIVIPIVFFLLRWLVGQLTEMIRKIQHTQQVDTLATIMLSKQIGYLQLGLSGVEHSSEELGLQAKTIFDEYVRSANAIEEMIKEQMRGGK